VPIVHPPSTGRVRGGAPPTIPQLPRKGSAKGPGIRSADFYTKVFLYHCVASQKAFHSSLHTSFTSVIQPPQGHKGLCKYVGNPFPVHQFAWFFYDKRYSPLFSQPGTTLSTPNHLSCLKALPRPSQQSPNFSMRHPKLFWIFFSFSPLCSSFILIILWLDSVRSLPRGNPHQ